MVSLEVKSLMNSKTIDIADIGTILLERSTRTRRIIISIRSDKHIRVAFPAGISFKQTLKFVNLKKPWIQKHLTEIKQIEQQRQLVISPVIDKTDARKKLTSRLHYLAQKHGFTYNSITIRNQKKRWGSCSHKNNISLNMKLVLLPEELIDYVIIHELVHTRVHDHSRRFWEELDKEELDKEELDKYVGNGKGKVMASRLREYGGSLL
jgi:predicted metal-dependent hydrolase